MVDEYCSMALFFFFFLFFWGNTRIPETVSNSTKLDQCFASRVKLLFNVLCLTQDLVQDLAELFTLRT